MSIIEKLKTESLRLRKDKNPIAPAIVFALSEIEKVGKNNGNRATTDDEAIKVVQKLVATIDENLAIEDIGDERRVALHHEKQILSSVLPQMASDEEIQDILRPLYAGVAKENRPNKGIAMKKIKEKFGAKVDMRRVNELLASYGA